MNHKGFIGVFVLIFFVLCAIALLYGLKHLNLSQESNPPTPNGKNIQLASPTMSPFATAIPTSQTKATSTPTSKASIAPEIMNDSTMTPNPTSSTKGKKDSGSPSFVGG
jgi:hypothetical protein